MSHLLFEYKLSDLSCIIRQFFAVLPLSMIFEERCIALS